MSKVTQKLFENFQQLDENLLTSEFTFGFELEAVVRNGSRIGGETNRDYDEIKDYLDDSLERGMPRELQGHSDIHNDQSVNAGPSEGDDDYDADIDYSDGPDIPFEYASKVIPCTPKWFDKVIKTLNEWMEDGIYTNDTCGFHHHLHFNGMTERDMVWIYCNMAADPKFAETFRKYDGFELNHYRWASYNSLNNLGVALVARHWDDVLTELNTKKWKAFRIHPQGTLEWRGPRDFLNHGDIETIKGFYLLFNELIGFVKKYEASNTLIGIPEITKDELFKNLKEAVKNADEKPDLEFIKHNESYDREKPIKFKAEGDALSEKTLKKIGDWFDKDINTFVSLVMTKDSRVGKYVVYTLTKGGDSPKLEALIGRSFVTMDNDQEKAKTFARNLLSIVKEQTSSDSIDFIETWLVDDCGLGGYLGKEVTVDRLLNCSSAARWNKLFNSYIKSSEGHVNIGVIEKSLKHLMDDHTFFDSVMNCLVKDYIVNYLGKDTVARVMTWLLRNKGNVEVRNFSYGTVEEVGKKCIGIITGTQYQQTWDSLLMNYIHSEPVLFSWLVERPNIKELIRLVSKNSNIIKYLTANELAEIKSYGLDI